MTSTVPHADATPSLASRLRGALRAWRERRAAGQCCRELMALYHRVAGAHPGLPGPELYRRVLDMHLGPYGPSAEQVLMGARESFASWPSERDLKFRDVVHFLAAMRLMDRPAGDRAVSADIRDVIDAAIPFQL